jgi:hypothetical protein
MGKLSKEVLTQIAAKRERMAAPDLAVSWRLSSLLQTFHYPLKHREESLRYFPIAVVATLEGYFRSRLALLIDSGQPFIASAMESYPDIKLDMALAGAIATRSVGLGEIIMHNISMSSFESLLAVVRNISGRPRFVEEVALATVDSVVNDSRSKKPIISDMDQIKARLSKVFSIRHILCHEFGDGVQLDDGEVRLTLLATQDFIKASSAWLDKLQNPNRLTYQQQVVRALAERDEEMLKLDAILTTIRSSANDADLPEVIAKEVAEIERNISAYLKTNTRLKRVLAEDHSRFPNYTSITDDSRVIRALTHSLQNAASELELASDWHKFRGNAPATEKEASKVRMKPARRASKK